jgi:ribosomal protein S6
MDTQSNDTKVGADMGNTAVYEASYLLLPTLSEEQVPGKVAGIKEALASFGATIISDEDPVLIDLAYQMVKVVQTNRYKADQGYFGWVKFELEKDSIKLVKKMLDESPDVLRHLIIKTVKENTLLNGKMKLKSEDKAKKFDDKDESEEEVLDVVKDDGVSEEVDKNIDDLVVA